MRGVWVVPVAVMVFTTIFAVSDGSKFQGKTGKTWRGDKAIGAPAFKRGRQEKFQKIDILSMERTYPEQKEKTAS